MLTRQGAVCVLTMTFVMLAGASVGAAQETGPSGVDGADQEVGGTLLGDGSSEVWAEDGSDLGSREHARPGGGNVQCTWWGMDPETEAAAGPIDWNYMRNPPPHLIGAEVTIIRNCVDANGVYSNEIVGLTLPTGQPPVVDPRDLALMARARLPLPLPEARMSPSDEQTAHLATWLWMEGWEVHTRTATAGGVTAMVTAEPVRQEWTFGSPGERKVCEGPGRRYDLSRPPSAQQTSCSYTFTRSSAGQPDDKYRVEATVVWAISWSSNVGASGDLGVVSRTVTIPTAVAEHQALGESGGDA